MSFGISVTSVEDLAAPDCRGGMWGQIHLRRFCKIAVLCTFQYGVLPVESGRFCFLSSTGSMDVTLNDGDPVKAARQPTNIHLHLTGTAATERITSTTAVHPSHA